jgi:hypothetical protein
MEVKRTFRFKLGGYDCISISDGTLPIPDLQPGKSRSQYDKDPGQFIEIMALD